jgi:hypothetical protein
MGIRLVPKLVQVGMEVGAVVITSYSSMRSVELVILGPRADYQAEPQLEDEIAPLPASSSFMTPPTTSRVSTELTPLPSVYSHRSHHDWDDKGDEKDIYAAPTLNRNHSEKKDVGFWRRITPSSWICRLLLLTVIVESLVDLAILVSLSLPTGI